MTDYGQNLSLRYVIASFGGYLPVYIRVLSILSELRSSIRGRFWVTFVPWVKAVDFPLLMHGASQKSVSTH